MQKIRLLKGSRYFYLATDPDGRKIRICEGYDYRHVPDNVHFEKGNYFSTLKAAENMVAIWEGALQGRSGVGIFHMTPEEVAELRREQDVVCLSRTDCDRLLEKGIGTLMPLEEFVARFNRYEISASGFIAKY